MKKLLLLSALCAAALGALQAMAVETGSALRNQPDTLDMRDHALSGARAQNVFQAVRGTYLLDDGSTLWLYRSGEKFVAEVRGQAPVEVMAIQNGKLIAVDGSTEIAFLKDDDGRVVDVVLSKRHKAG